MAQITLRKMRPQDAPRALAILAQWNMAPTPASPERPDPERATLDVANSFVALADEALVGVASYCLHPGGLGETASLAVDPAWRGAGIGMRLQQARLAEMKARGVTRVRTEADRPETIAWYQRKFGYRIVGTQPKKHAFGLAEVEQWTVLELDLEGDAPTA